MLTRNSSILTLFMSGVMKICSRYHFESSFHRSQVLNVFLSYFIRIKQTFWPCNARNKMPTLNFRMRCEKFYYLSRKRWRAIICKNDFGVRIPNIGPDLNQNRYNSRLSSLSSADSLVDCSIVHVAEHYTFAPQTFDEGNCDAYCMKTERELIVLSEDTFT